MILSEKINKILPYFKGIDVIEDKFVVKVQLEKGWFCYEKPNTFSVMKINDEKNTWAVMCDAKSKNSDDIFDFINEIIETNKSVKLKMDLLKIKINDLKELFAVTPFEELLNLKFVIENEDNNKKKRKYTRKVKKIEENEIPTILENNEEKKEIIESEVV